MDPWDIVNNVAMNIGVQMSESLLSILLDLLLGMGLLALYTLRNLYIAHGTIILYFHSGCTILHCY